MTTISNSAVAWAAKRGIGKGTLDRFGVGSGMAGMPPDGHRCEIIIFPYQRGTRTVNWKARALDNKEFMQKTGGELRFFNLDAVLAGTAQAVYITEGEMDALALAEAGVPAEQVVSVPNGAPVRSSEQPEEQDRYRFVDAGLEEGFSRFKRYILLTDNDAPGLALRQDLVRLLGPARCWFVEWPREVKDANDVLLQHWA